MPVRAILAALLAVLMVDCSSAIAREVETGVLTATVADGFEQGESRTDYRLRADGQAIPVVPTVPVDSMIGDRVTVRGEMTNGHLVGSVAQTVEVADPPLDGGRTVAVVLVNVESAPEEPWTIAQVRDEVLEEDSSFPAFYRKESHGKIWFTGKREASGDVLGWYTLDARPCDRWEAEAEQRAAEEGIDLSGYDHVMYVTPWRCGSHRGEASVGGPFSRIGGGLWKYVMTHEIGHNLGWGHANALRCFDAEGVEAVLSETVSQCFEFEYWDPFDVMGDALRHNHGWFLGMIGALEPSNVVTVSEPGTYIYSIASNLHKTNLPTVIRTPRKWSVTGDVILWYDLEIREASESDEESWAERVSLDDGSVTGVSLRSQGATESESVLIDTTAERDVHGNMSFYDAPLEAGDVFDDGRVRIEVLEVTKGRATVSLQIDEFAEDEFAPTPPLLEQVRQIGPGIRLQWSASEDDLGVARYVVLRNGDEVGSTTELSFTDPNPPMGLHSYVVHAEDASGHRSKPSNPLTYRMQEAPTTPVLLRVDGVGAGVELEWEASEDNDGVVRYAVYRNDEFLGVTGDLTYVDESPPEGLHAYTVLALEGGYWSELSNAMMYRVRYVPNPPVLEEVNGAGSDVELTWRNGEDELDVVRYAVFRNGTQIATSTGPTYADLDLSPGVYKYKIYAEVGSGHRSNASNTIAYEVKDELAPTKPSGLEASASAKGIALTWQQSTDNVGGIKYVILRDEVQIGTSSTPAFADPALPSSPRVYLVYSEDKAGNKSPFSDPLPVADEIPPEAPEDLQAVASSAGVTLSWNASSDNVKVARYIVVRNGEEVGNAPSNQYQDSAFSSGSRTYVVLAEDQAGNRSGPSTAVEVAAQTVGTKTPDVLNPTMGGTRPAPTGTGTVDRRNPRLRFSWYRKGRDKLVFLAKDLAMSAGTRLELWIDGRLIRAVRGPRLKVVWRRPTTGARSHLVQVREVSDGKLLAVKGARIFTERPTRKAGRRSCCLPSSRIFGASLLNAQDTAGLSLEYAAMQSFP